MGEGLLLLSFLDTGKVMYCHSCTQESLASPALYISHINCETSYLISNSKKCSEGDRQASSPVSSPGDNAAQATCVARCVVPQYNLPDQGDREPLGLAQGRKKSPVVPSCLTAQGGQYLLSTPLGPAMSLLDTSTPT